MSENPNPKPEPSLSDEILRLGDALGDFFKTAWASQERKDLQQKMQVSLKEVGDSLSQAAQKFEQSEEGQRFKSEVQNIAQRVESGEVQAKVHNELLTALQKATAEELKRAGAVATDQPSLVIEDFSHGYRDWYLFSAENPQHWQFWTRKINDPKWRGKPSNRLCFDVRSERPNRLIVAENLI